MIQSVSRTFTILEIIARNGGEAKLQEIASLSGIKQTTAHNLLKTLCQLGYVVRNQGSTGYFLSRRMSNLSRVSGNDYQLRESLMPLLADITKRTEETSFIAVPSGGEVFFLAGLECDKAIKHTSPEGLRTPMPGSAAGLVLMAWIPDIFDWMKPEHRMAIGEDIEKAIEVTRARGFALDLEKVEKGLNCVAIPYFKEGQLEAVVGISGPAFRLPEQKLISNAQWMQSYLSALSL